MRAPELSLKGGGVIYSTLILKLEWFLGGPREEGDRNLKRRRNEKKKTAAQGLPAWTARTAVQAVKIFTA